MKMGAPVISPPANWSGGGASRGTNNRGATAGKRRFCDCPRSVGGTRQFCAAQQQIEVLLAHEHAILLRVATYRYSRM